MLHPSESVSSSNSENDEKRQTLIALIPFMIAIPCLIIAAILWFWSPCSQNSNCIAFGVVGAILCFDIPVCVFVFIQWLSTGKPPELSFSPLIPSRTEREFRRTLHDRPKLNDDEFYNRFYANTEIPKQLVVQLRTSLGHCYGLDLGGLQPNDNLIYADDEIDFRDVVIRFEREFNIAIPDSRIEKLDGTFDSLVHCISDSIIGWRRE